MTSYQAIHQAENDLVNHPSTQHYSAVRVIQNDAEALDVAQQLAEQFKTQSIERDAQRILPFAEIEAFSQSGLWAITVQKYLASRLPKLLRCLVALMDQLVRFRKTIFMHWKC